MIAQILQDGESLASSSQQTSTERLSSASPLLSQSSPKNPPHRKAGGCFDIRDHLDKLKSDGGSEAKAEKSFFCPVCSNKNFKVNLKTGAYSSFGGCGCADTEEGKKKIRHALSPAKNPNKANQTPTKEPRPKQHRGWEYVDKEGNFLFCIHRWDDPDGKSEDGFSNGRCIRQSFSRKDVTSWGQQIWKKDGKKPGDFNHLAQPYGLAEAKQDLENGAAYVLFVEGEPCVDACRAIGIPAICNLGGAGKYKSKRDAGQIPADRLVATPDRDKPGLKHAQDVAAANPGCRWFYPFAGSPEWNGAMPEKHGLDIADWIELGGTAIQITKGITSPEGNEKAVLKEKIKAGDTHRKLLIGLEVLDEIESPTERFISLQNLREETGLTNGKAFDQAISTLLDEQRNDKDCTLAELMARKNNASFILDQFGCKGALVGIGGDKGDGKTILMYRGAAAVASGEALFGELTVQQGPAIIVQCDESDLNAQKKFISMGIDPSLPIHWMWGFNPSMIPELKRKIQKTGAKFVGIDSITTVAGGRGIKFTDPDFALFLYQLNHLAAELGVVIFILIHLRKPDSAKGARTEVTLNDFLGTGMLTSACSDVFGYWSNKAEDAFPDQYILRCLGKRNCEAGTTWDLQGSKDDFSLQFAGVQGGGDTPSEKRSVIAKALDFLRQRKGDPCSTEQIAQGIGAHEKTVRNALRDYFSNGNALGIQRVKAESTGGRPSFEWIF